MERDHTVHLSHQQSTYQRALSEREQTIISLESRLQTLHQDLERAQSMIQKKEQMIEGKSCHVCVMHL